MRGNTLAWSPVAIGTLVLGVLRFAESRNPYNSLNSRIDSIVKTRDQTELSCVDFEATRSLVLLALGQSNAGNHGSLIAAGMGPVTLIAEGRCILASDPLPGATGTGGSIWQRLPRLLSRSTISRPVVLSILAVDASTINDWTNPSSPLRKCLVAQIESMHALRLPPGMVLWQQGEADALGGNSTQNYAQNLAALAAIVTATDANVPILLARSAICRSPPNASIRSAIEFATANNRHFRLGPDTDILSGSRFRDGCHLTADGLDSAAKMWVAPIE